MNNYNDDKKPVLPVVSPNDVLPLTAGNPNPVQK